MIDFALITSKFREIQNLAHELSVNIHKDSLLYSNLQKVDLIPDPSTYLSAVITEIEISTSFQELDKHVEEYVYDCESEASFPDLDAEEKKEYHIQRDKFRLPQELEELITEQDLKSYDSEDSPSHLQSWLRITNFYHQKILNKDTSDWTTNLLDDLKNYPKQKGVTHCLVALDGIFPGRVKIGRGQTVHEKCPEIKMLNRIKNHSEYPEAFTSQYGWYDGVWPDNLNLDRFHYLHRRVPDELCGRQIAENNRDNLLGKEIAVLMLVARYNIRTPNLYFIPDSPFDGELILFNAVQSMPEFHWQLENVLFLPEDRGSIQSITVANCERNDFQACCQAIYRMLTEWFPKVKAPRLTIPIDLYIHACETRNDTISFLLFCTCLESLLIGKPRGELTETFATRLALILGVSENERHRLYVQGRKIYSLRSDLAHGKDTDSLRPYSSPKARESGITRERMRDLARASILAALTINAILAGSEPELQKQIKTCTAQEADKWHGILEHLHDHLFDSNSRNIVLGAMRSWWHARVPSAGKVMRLPFLDRESI